MAQRPLEGRAASPRSCCWRGTLLNSSVSCRYLKPDENKKSKHKTAVKKKTLNPEFNEVKSTSAGFQPGPPDLRIPKSLPVSSRSGAICGVSGQPAASNVLLGFQPAAAAAVAKTPDELAAVLQSSQLTFDLLG